MPSPARRKNARILEYFEFLQRRWMASGEWRVACERCRKKNHGQSNAKHENRAKSGRRCCRENHGRKFALRLPCACDSFNFNTMNKQDVAFQWVRRISDAFAKIPTWLICVMLLYYPLDMLIRYHDAGNAHKITILEHPVTLILSQRYQDCFYFTSNLAYAAAKYCGVWLLNLVGLIVALLPCILILNSRSSFWHSDKLKHMACFAIILLQIRTEVDPTICDIHFHFGILAFVILLEDPVENRGRTIFYGLLLFLAGMSVGISSLLFLAYAVKGIQQHSRSFLFFAALLLLTGMIHYLLLTVAPTYNPEDVDRSDIDRNDPIYLVIYLLAFFSQGLHIWIFGDRFHQPLMNVAMFFLKMDSLHWAEMYLLLAVPIGLILYALYKRLGLHAAYMSCAFIVLYLVLPAVSQAGNSIDILPPGHHSRYFYVPNFILGMMMLKALDLSGNWPTLTRDALLRTRRGRIELACLCILIGFVILDLFVWGHKIWIRLS